MDTETIAYMPKECSKFYDLMEEFRCSPPIDLQFQQPPIGSGIPYMKSKAYLSPNKGLFALKSTSLDGQKVIEAQVLGATIIQLARILHPQLVEEVCVLLDQIETLKGRVWNQLCEKHEIRPPSFGSEDASDGLLDIPRICAVSSLFHKEFSNLSESNTQILYDTAKLIARKCLTSSAEDQRNILKHVESLPKSIKGLPALLGMEGDDQDSQYIVCPTCFALYNQETMEPIQKPYKKRFPLTSTFPSFSVAQDNPHLYDKESEYGRSEDEDEDEDEEDEGGGENDLSQEERNKDEEIWAKAPGYHCLAAVDGICTAQYTPSSRPCGAALFKAPQEKPAHKQTSMKAPIKTFSVPSLKAFLERLLAKPNVRECMQDFTKSQHQNEDSINDLFFSPYVQSLVDKDGRSFLGSERPADEIRLCLGLYIDWFGPRGNKRGAAHYSSGAIYITILNLPPTMRYKEEYLYPIFIPGPFEPTTDGLNHLLGPLIDQLQSLWNEGFTMPIQQSGEVMTEIYRVLVMLAVIIADNPAASKCGGFASHGHRFFCHHCRLERGLISNLCIHEWKKLTYEEHLVIIEAWRDAPSVQVRREIFETWGLRWTELARLEYLNITSCFIIDPMHALLLGGIQNHIRELFGITGRVEPNIHSTKEKSSNESRIYPEEQLVGEEILTRQFLNVKLLDLLFGLHLSTLEYLCGQREIIHKTSRPRKVELVTSLANWVESNRPDQAVTFIDHKHIDTILKDDSLSYAQKDLFLSSQSEKLLYRYCEDQELELSELPYRLYFPTKSSMIQLLLSEKGVQRNPSPLNLWRQNYDLKFKIKAGNDLNPSSKKKLGPPPLVGDNLLRQIWEDISHLSFPPGATDLPPKKLGLAREGKLKAAQWPNVCIALAFSLSKNWLHLSTFQEQKWLENFYHLICLIRILFLYSINVHDVEDYQRHCLEYIKGIQTLFPNHQMKPNHHYLLHLGELMSQFGPMRSWWSFPFERLNGVIQKIRTSNRSGEIEKKFLQTFLYRQRLTSLLLHPTLQDFNQLIHKSEKANIAALKLPDARPNNTLSPLISEFICKTLINSTENTGTLFSSLLKQLTVLPSIKVNGQRFQPASVSANHSLVLLNNAKSDEEMKIGYIQEIYAYKQAEDDLSHVFAVIDLLEISKDEPSISISRIQAHIFDTEKRTRHAISATELSSVIWAPWSSNKIFAFVPYHSS